MAAGGCALEHPSRGASQKKTEIITFLIEFSKFSIRIIEISWSPAPPAVTNWAVATYAELFVLFLEDVQHSPAPLGAFSGGQGALRGFG